VSLGIKGSGTFRAIGVAKVNDSRVITGWYNDFLLSLRTDRFAVGSAVSAQYRAFLNGTGTTSATSTLRAVDGAGRVLLEARDDGFLMSPQTYGNTSGAAANVSIGWDGAFVRSTSALKYKAVKRAIPQSMVDKVMALRGFLYADVNDPDGRLYVGMAADHFHDVGLHEFVSYGADGEPEGLMYDRIVPILIEGFEQRFAALDERLRRLGG